MSWVTDPASQQARSVGIDVMTGGNRGKGTADEKTRLKSIRNILR